MHRPGDRAAGPAASRCPRRRGCATRSQPAHSHLEPPGPGARSLQPGILQPSIPDSPLPNFSRLSFLTFFFFFFRSHFAFSFSQFLFCASCHFTIYF